MAQGTVTLFDNFAEELLRGTHDLDADVIKVALMTTDIDSYTGTETDWANVSANEVSGTNYTAGGETMTVNVSETGGTATYDFTTNPSWTQSGTGPAVIRSAIIYNSSAASNDLIARMDMTEDSGTTPISLQDGDITITWHANGLFQVVI